jgi:hypothetical protein
MVVSIQLIVFWEVTFRAVNVCSLADVTNLMKDLGTSDVDAARMSFFLTLELKTSTLASLTYHWCLHLVEAVRVIFVVVSVGCLTALNYLLILSQAAAFIENGRLAWEHPHAPQLGIFFARCSHSILMMKLIFALGLLPQRLFFTLMRRVFMLTAWRLWWQFRGFRFHLIKLDVIYGL